MIYKYFPPVCVLSFHFLNGNFFCFHVLLFLGVLLFFLIFGSDQFLFLFIYLCLTSLLEYNCFTMVCYFLLYNKVNQLYIYIYPHISTLLRLPSAVPYPTPLGGHKVLS